ncbi:cupin domain-containing protein [Plastoroseomonas hellenica]|uniref:hypothetical protein n=1 Tax=Plastoroseomonas hellenica TaxID=2687306 RepID=UPI001BABCBF9|nr:hypothetical protein [Plastoroseomonas hellenica]MBR0645634.1 hypothetical protein [Plastoroseomonas hellenica]
MSVAAADTVKMNTRTGHLPDVTDIDHPLVAESVRAIAALRRRQLSVAEFQSMIRALHDRLDLTACLAPWIARALDERKDQVLYRRTGDDGRETIQLFYIEPGEVHPPHAHHNIVSTQMVLHGQAHIREYDIIARLTPERLLLRLATDRWFQPGEAMRTTEIDRNMHWFAAGAQPAVMLNFNVYGCQDWTLDPPGQAFQRRIVDPTIEAQPDGLIIGHEITLEAGYRKFAGRPLTDFAIPRYRSPAG